MSNEGKSRVFCRNSVDIQDYHRFKTVPDSFQKQFCSLYQSRLGMLKERLLRQIKIKWGTKYEILDIVDLAKDDTDSNKKCIIIGTLYKHQELKPSILKEMCKELQLPMQNRSSQSDSLFLEDDIQKLKLAGNLNAGKLVTGIICAVMGHDLKNGTFWVDDWCFPGQYENIEKSVINNTKQNEPYIIIISGLNLMHNINLMSLNLLQEWIMGMAGNDSEQNQSSKLLTMIVAGNSITSEVEKFSRDGYFKQNSVNSSAISDVTATLKVFDDFLNQVVQNCHVILMPGEFDPSNHLVPQRPFHFHILPKASRFTSLHTVTNPWIGKVESRLITATSGQPISDIMKLADIEYSAMDWMKKTLEWQHYAPTSPDTLDVYPYYQCDPFVMQESPEIYLTGNMDKYETDLIRDNEGRKTRLICVPEFSKTQTAVLVNLNTLDANTISFGINL